LSLIEGNIIGHPQVGNDTLWAELDQLGQRHRELAHDESSQDDFDKLAISLQTAALRACSRTSAAIDDALGFAFAAVTGLGIAVVPETIAPLNDIPVPPKDHLPARVRDQTWVDHVNAIAPGLQVQGVLVGAAIALGFGTGGWGLLLIPPLAGLAFHAQNVVDRRARFLEWVDDYVEMVDGLARRACQSNIDALSTREVEEKVDALLDAEIQATSVIVARLTRALTGDRRTRADEAQRVRSIVTDQAARRSDAFQLLATLTAEPKQQPH
jgi:hypothetical protein